MVLLALLVALTPLNLDQILARNLEARGGAQKLAALQSLELHGKLIFGRDGGSVTSEWALMRKRPGMLRAETTRQGLTSIQAYDGTQSWSVDPFGGRRDPFRTSADEARALAQEADIDGPLVNWREKGHQVTWLGTEDVDGTPALKLRVALKDGDTQYVYLDPDYFLEIRRVNQRHLRGTERITETDYGSYAQVNG